MTAFIMNEDNNNQGRLIERAQPLGTVTEEMVRERAAQLAKLNGRPTGRVLDSDLQQARHELTGADTLVPEPTPAEQLPEDKRWDPVPGTAGHQAPKVTPTDEQTVAEELIEEGLEEAEQDTMVEGEREERRGRRS